MSPGPNVASVIVRPSAWLRIARAWPLADDVAGVAVVALAEHQLPGLERARHGQLGDPLEVAVLERLEDRHARPAARVALRAHHPPSPHAKYHTDGRGLRPEGPTCRSLGDRRESATRAIFTSMAAVSRLRTLPGASARRRSRGLLAAAGAIVPSARPPSASGPPAARATRQARAERPASCCARTNCGPRSTSATPPTSPTRSASAARCRATARRADEMYMSFRLEYLNAVNQWVELPTRQQRPPASSTSGDASATARAARASR